MDKCRSLWHISADNSQIFTSNLNPESNQLVVKAIYSAVSLGTERLVACGKIPESAYKAMAVPFMEGSFSLPVKYGYSLVGEVIWGSRYKGEKVHVMHPHQDYCVVDPKDCTILPSALPVKRATLTSNVETAVTAFWDGEIRDGMRVLIIGFGQIGSLIARVIRMETNAVIDIVETNPGRAALASRMDFNHVEQPSESYQVAYNCSSSHHGLNTAIKAVGIEGKVVECSWYGNNKVELDLGSNFHFNRVQIISSQVSHIPLAKQTDWNHTKRKEWVLELLKNEDFDAHITDTIPFEKSPEFFKKVRNYETPGLGYCFSYEN